MKAPNPEPDSPKVGAYILESLTTGMYTDPLDALRELIQNCADAIRKAEETHVLSPGEGRVVVTIHGKQRTLVVKDNGIGVPKDSVRETLQNIGMSNKRIGIDAGFRGIGRLASIAYCKSMVFKTSAAGEATTTTLTLDCAGIRKACAPSMRQVEELSKVLREHTTIRHEACEKNDHFFEVELIGLDTNADVFLDLDELKDYLAQVAPVELDAQHFMYATVIQSWMKEHHLSLHTISLVLKDGKITHQVFKPYKTHYKTMKTKGGGLALDIKGVKFFPENLEPNAPFWLWYGDTDLLGSIDDSRSAGFRTRKHNISLGWGDGSSKIFTETAESNERFNNYFIGEIHVLAEDSIPNSRRDGFEDSPSWQSIKNELKKFFAERVKEIRKTSTARNTPVQKLTKTVKETLSAAKDRAGKGFASDKQKEEQVESLKREQKKLEEASRSERDANATSQIKSMISEVGKALAEIQTNSKYSAQNLDSALDRKQRKVIQDILELLHFVLDADAFAKAEGAILGQFGVGTEKGKNRAIRPIRGTLGNSCITQVAQG